MELISYMLSLVITFLGLFAGLFLAYIAPEELKPGEKYHLLLQKLLLSSILALYAGYALSNLTIGVILFALVFLVVTYQNISSRAAYLYGFPTGTLFVKKHIKKKKWFVIKRLFLSYWFYLVLAVVIYLVKLFF